jgi:capsular exopolysaccharide synthesis family protein
VDAASVEIEKIRKIRLRLVRGSPTLPFGDDYWLANEQYRILRTKLLHHVKRPQVILVSSAGSGDGKSITAINLAGVLSLRSETGVLLVDGDFRRPNIHVQLGVPESPGLGEILEGRCEPLEAIVAAEEFPNLFFVAAGKPIDNPAELLQSSRWSSVAAWLKKQFRYVILDSPPIAAVADYDLLQSMCDGVIVVVRPDHTTRSACKSALESVPRDKLLGVLINCVPEWPLGQSFGYGTPAYYRVK